MDSLAARRCSRARWPRSPRCSSRCRTEYPTSPRARWSAASFRSRYRHTDVGWTIAYPPGSTHGARLPVLVVAARPRRRPQRRLRREPAPGQATSPTPCTHGVRPFAIASVDGGDHEYWHPRRGTDPAGMVVHEFLPLLARHGLDVTRIGLLGSSMGGYGALYLAEPARRASGGGRRRREPGHLAPPRPDRGRRVRRRRRLRRAHDLRGAAVAAPARHRAAHRLRRRRTDSPRSRATCAPACTRARPAASNRAATIPPSGARRRRHNCASSGGTCSRTTSRGRQRWNAARRSGADAAWRSRRTRAFSSSQRVRQ